MSNAPGRQSAVRPATWLPDPLDDTLIRYWDGARWTFYTAVRPGPAAVEPSVPAAQPVAPALRPDVAQALQRVRGLLVGSMKEVNLLASYLRPEERVLALTGGHGEGLGVLACTNHRILFLFVGLVRRQFIEVSWNQAKAVIYNQHSKFFFVYTTRPTKRAYPPWRSASTTSVTRMQWPMPLSMPPRRPDLMSSEDNEAGGTGPPMALN